MSMRSHELASVSTVCTGPRGWGSVIGLEQMGSQKKEAILEQKVSFVKINA